jgi:peptidoglycan/LPS O-acetylase OafA/YrhL
MRGIAALAVICSHIIATFGSVNKYLNLTPLYFFWSSHESVIFFFVLSGFVLSLPFYKREVKYVDFIIRRMFRIYLPYIVAIAFTFLMCYLFASHGDLKGISEWTSTKWNRDINRKDILNHILLIGNYETTTFNPAIWSLVHEMRISLFFPLIMILILRYNWKSNILVAFLLSLVGSLNQIVHVEISKGFFTSYLDSLHYMSMFIIGALIF